jgi:NADPH2:quinone reductase
MKEAQVAQDLSVSIKDVAVPEPQANQVVIRVIVSGSNPKDWYLHPSPPFYMPIHSRPT